MLFGKRGIVNQLIWEKVQIKCTEHLINSQIIDITNVFSPFSKEVVIGTRYLNCSEIFILSNHWNWLRTHGVFRTVRYICGCLQRCVVSKWPHERLVRTRVVSGFIFLRLLCPAILNPRQFNLISGRCLEEILLANFLKIKSYLIRIMTPLWHFPPIHPFTMFWGFFQTLHYFVFAKSIIGLHFNRFTKNFA